LIDVEYTGDNDFSLIYVLTHTELLNEFIEFVDKKLFCLENFDFWFACVDYQNTLDDVERKEKGITLSRLYIGSDSEFEVNLPRSLVKPLLDCIAKVCLI
jgi:hypothetical protein